MPEKTTLYQNEKRLLAGKQYKGLTGVDGPLVFMRKTHPVGYKELVELSEPDGRTRLGMVLDTSDDTVVVQVFDGTLGLSMPHTSARFMGEPLTLPVSENCLVLCGNPPQPTRTHPGMGSRSPKEWSFVTGFFHSAYCFQGSSLLFHGSDFIVWLHNIPPCSHTTFYLPIHRLVNISVAFTC